MSRKLRATWETVLGWFYFFSFYMALGIIIISIVQHFKSGLQLSLILPLLIKWELVVVIFSVVTGIFLFIFQNFLNGLPIKGFLRAFLIYFGSYFITIVTISSVFYKIPILNIRVPLVEGHIGFIMIALLILRLFPQKNFNDPEGPKFKLPIDNFKKNKYEEFGTFRTGIKFYEELGTPVYAAADGEVSIAMPFKNYGNMIKIKHGDNFSTIYAHLDEIEVGFRDEVKQGDLIGYVGRTGHAFRPNLHFEVRFKNRVVDPTVYIKRLSSDLSYNEDKKKDK